MLLLDHSLPENVLHIVGSQGLLKFRLSRRVNPFSDHHRIRSNLHRLGIGGNHCFCLFFRKPLLLSPAPLCQFLNMFRRSSAAAARYGNAQIHQLFHGLGKRFPVNIIDRFSALASGKSCIRIHNDWKRGVLDVLFHNFLHLHRSQAAVDAQRVHSQPLQQGNDGAGRSAC